MDNLPNASTENTPSPVPWTPHDVVLALAFFVGWMFTMALLTEASRLAHLALDPGAVVIVGTSLLLLPVWYFSFHKYKTGWVALGLRPFNFSALKIGCGLMLASVVFNMLFAAFLALFDLRIQPDTTVMFESTDFPVVLLLGGALVAPFVEEVFFRGFVFAGLQHRWDWKIAAAVSAGVFALAHIVPTSVIPIFILGLIFAFLYRLSNSIWPAILMHMLTNTVALSVAFAVSQGWIAVP